MRDEILLACAFTCLKLSIEMVVEEIKSPVVGRQNFEKRCLSKQWLFVAFSVHQHLDAKNRLNDFLFDYFFSSL